MAKSEIKTIIKESGAKMLPLKNIELDAKFARGLEEIDLLKENFGQLEKLTDQVTKYLEESTTELKHLRYYRIVTMVVAAALLGFLLTLLYVVIFHHQVWFYLQGAFTRSALIVSTLGGSIILMTVVLRGVFKATSERSKEDGLPEHLKLTLDAVKTAVSTIKS